MGKLDCGSGSGWWSLLRVSSWWDSPWRNSGSRGCGPKLVTGREHGKCRDMGSGCHLSHLPLGHCPESAAAVSRSGVQKRGCL